jgi:Concanavalin A-like lectin/glucanases superfamily
MKPKNLKTTLWIGSAFIFATFLFSSCSTSNSGPTTTPPPSNPGGYDSSNQIQPQALVAYFPFNNNAITETKENFTFTNSGMTFVTGVKGQALQGAAGKFATYVSAAPIASLQGIQSFTVAFWIKSGVVDTTIGPTYTPGHGAQGIFYLVDTAQQWGNLEVDLEPYKANPDTLQIKCGFRQNASGTVWNGWGPVLKLPAAVGVWTHVVFTYNGASGTLTGYENGVQGGSNSLGGPYGPWNGQEICYANDPGSPTNSNHAPVLGPLQFENLISMEFGTWSWDTSPQLFTHAAPRGNNWEDDFAGALDEFRIYNVALNATDVNSLWILEKAGF